MRVCLALVNLKHAFDISDQNLTDPSLVKPIEDALDCQVSYLEAIEVFNCFAEFCKL